MTIVENSFGLQKIGWRSVVPTSFCYQCKLLCITCLVPNPMQEQIAKWLNTALPTIVPTPISPRITKTPMTLVKSSGDDVAIPINVAPAISLSKWSSKILHIIN